MMGNRGKLFRIPTDNRILTKIIIRLMEEMYGWCVNCSKTCRNYFQSRQNRRRNTPELSFIDSFHTHSSRYPSFRYQYYRLLISVFQSLRYHSPQYRSPIPTTLKFPCTNPSTSKNSFNTPPPCLFPLILTWERKSPRNKSSKTNASVMIFHQYGSFYYRCSPIEIPIPISNTNPLDTINSNMCVLPLISSIVMYLYKSL